MKIQPEDDTADDDDTNVDCSKDSPDKLNELVAKNKESQEEEKEEVVKERIQERDYQTALFELSVGQNTILCLPTGSGKTYIAVQLAKHFLADAIRKDQIIVFLANSIPLIHQQGKYLRENLSTHFNKVDELVCVLTGDLNVRKYIKEKKYENEWRDVLKKQKIYAMTAQIFLDCLNFSHVIWKDVCLLIFDECHNAVGDHFMAEIMKHYHERKASNYNPLPRIVGLTATIINGTCHERNIAYNIMEIESCFDAKAVTYHEYEEVLKYSTNAMVQNIYFMDQVEYSWNSLDLLSGLLEMKSFLDLIPPVIFDERCKKAEDIQHSSLSSYNQIFAGHRKPPQAKLISIIKDVETIFNELGPYCARLACRLKLMFIVMSMEREENEDSIDLFRVVETCLNLLHGSLDYLMNCMDNQTQVEVFITHKLKQLCNVLEENGSSKDSFCGLVFADKRLTVQVLSWYFHDRAKFCEFSGFIKPFFVVGSSGIGTDAEEARITSAKQAQAIEKFHNKEYNLLFATKVLEEGINVPICNIVVRFNPIKTYPSFVQSMGRARKKDAKFFVFIEGTKSKAEIKKLAKFTSFNITLAEYLKVNALHPEDMVPSFDNLIPPFRPGGDIDHPQVTMTSAISLVYRYCATLSCDRLVTLAPVSWFKEVGVNSFRVYVLLPSNSAYREVIEGPPLEDKYTAKRAAFLKTCKILYEVGALNDSLCPTSRDIPAQMSVFLDEIDEELKRDGREGKPGTNKRTQWYFKKLPQAIENSEIRLGTICNVYAIKMKQHDIIVKEEASLYHFENRKYLFGIASSVDLSKLSSFPIFGRSGTLLVSFEKICVHHPEGSPHRKEVSFTLKEIKQLRETQDLIFSQLVGIKNRFFKTSEKNSFLLIPIKKGEQEGEHTIDWQLLSLLKSATDEDNLIREPSEAERKATALYSLVDGIVVPWYGVPAPKPTTRYCVVDVMNSMNPYSDFVEDPTKWTNYAAYYEARYKLTPFLKTQPLLKCKEIGKQLNFLNEKGQDSLKKKKEKSNILPHLLPEFANKYPVSGSYYIQARFLPSVLHRMSRLLLANEIREAVANHFSWKSALSANAEMEIDWSSLINSSGEPRAPLVSPCEYKNLTQESCSQSSNVSSEALELTTKEPQEKISLNIKSDKGDSDANAFHYEFIHPMRLKKKEIIKQERKQRELNAKQAARPSVYEGIHGHEPPAARTLSTGIRLISPNEIQFKSLDERTNFELEKGPSAYRILEALTLSKANDYLSLEKLEVIGDSVLKLCISQFIFTMNPDWQEGKMTALRNRLVSNAHLYFFAKKNQLGEFLSGGIFKPDCCWTPPGLTISPHIGKVASVVGSTCSIFDELSLQEVEDLDEVSLLNWAKDYVGAKKESFRTSYTQSELGDKAVADSVEALIGAYYMHGGLDSALRFMEWFGLRGPLEKEEIQIPYSRPNSTKLPKYPNGRQILIPLIADIENLICYKFKNPWILVEAFTHPGCIRNRTTGGYQRLEFLGDAILDFLITNHIYSYVQTPGKLTDLKSALVNNVTFASLIVRYDLHKHLISTSKLLQDSIDRFVEYQEECGHQVTAHFKLLNDMECLIAEEVEVPKILGDLFESLAGAVYIDSDLSLDTVWRVFYRLMKNDIEIFSKNIPISPIREIYEMFPGIKFKDPSNDENMKEICNDMGWTVMVLDVPKLKKRIFGCGKNKQEAKAAAAKCAVKKVKELQKKENEEADTIIANST